MIAALYARYSSDRQRAESITAQLRYGREYCRRHGYSIVHEYKDLAMTGTNDNRQAFQQMLADARSGMFDVAVIHKCDRFGRNEYDYYTNKADLERCGVRVEYAGQSFDSNTPEGKLMENQLVGLAAYYSRNLANEVKKGQRENVYEGKCTNGSLAWGYVTDKSKYIIIDDHKAVAVRHIFQSYADGQGYAPIKRWLKEHGYTTARGGDFTSTSLHDMLTNPRYVGTAILGKNVPLSNGKRNNHRKLHDGCVIVENAHPAIIDKQVFEKVAQRMRANRHRGGSGTAKHVYLLSGLLYCGECGSSMPGTAIRKGHSDYVKRYYRCGKRQRESIDACANRCIDADALEHFVTVRVMQTITSESFMDMLVSKVTDAYTSLRNTAADDDPSELLAKKKKLRSALSRLYDLIEDGTADEYDKERLSNVKADLRSIDMHLSEISNRANLPAIPPSTIRKYIKEKFDAYIQKNSAENIRAILENFVERIIVSTDTITIRHKFVLDWCDWIGTAHGQLGITYDDIYPRIMISA